MPPSPHPRRHPSPHPPGDGPPTGIPFRPALLAARAGIWDYDAAGDRMCFCGGAARVLGWPMEASRTGLPLARTADYVHPDDRVSYLYRITAGQGEGGRVSASFRTAPGEGGCREVLLQGRFASVPAPGAGGGLAGQLVGQGVVVEVAGAGAAADAVEARDRLPESAALLTSIDLIIAARRAMLDLDPAARSVALTAVDSLLLLLGRQVAAAGPRAAFER